MTYQTSYKIGHLLDTLVRAIGEPGNLRSTLQSIAQTALEFFQADYCTFFSFNPVTGRSIVPTIISGSLPGENRAFYDRQKLDELLQHVVQEDLVLIADLNAVPEYQKALLDTNVHSLIACTLRTNQQQKPLGALFLYFKRQQQFSIDDQEVVRTFARQVSFVLQETWLLLRYRAVAEIGQEINQELATLDQLFQKLKSKVLSILDSGYAFLLAAYEPQTNTFDIYLEDKGHTIHQESTVLNGACLYVIKTLRPQFIRELSKEAEHLSFRLNHIAGTGTMESFIFVPLLLRGTALGVLSIQHPLPNAYNEEDQSILQLLASHIALALTNMRLYSNMQQLNETGQFLTQQLDSKSVLEEIRNTTKADSVVLYPYEPIQQVMLPPYAVGLLKPPPSQPLSTDWPDIAKLILQHTEPIFGKKSSSIYALFYGNEDLRYGSFQERENIQSTAAIPLHVGEQTFGVLFVNFCQPQRFDAPQKLFIESLAHYAAISIKNARALETLLQRRIDELETLQEIDLALNRNLDLAHVLNTLLELACKRVSADRASILLYNSQEQLLEAKATTGMYTEVNQASGMHLTELAVPLRDGEEVIGVLNFESTKDGAFNQDDKAFLHTLAGQAVLAIKKAQAYEREKRFAEEAQVLNQISREITSQLNADHVFDLILEKALELTHSKTGVLMLYDPERNDLEMVRERGVLEDKKGRRHGLDEGIVGHVARSKQWLNVDPSQPSWNKVYLHYIPGTRSELAVPMLEGETIRGVLNIESDSPNNFGEGDVRLLLGLADLAVVALQNAERYDKAEREKRRFELLYQAGRELGKIGDLAQLEQAYDVTLHIAKQYTQSEVFIRRYDEDTEEFVLLAASQLPKAASQQQINMVIPIQFNDRYYGSLELSHREIVKFKDTDKDFFESLAHQLASTIYRLETAQARQESEQRARAAEDVSWIGQSTLGLTHRLGILGLIAGYVDDIQKEMERRAINKPFIAKKLANIKDVVGKVLQLSVRLKQELAKSGEEMISEQVIISPHLLIEDVYTHFKSWLPSTIQITMAVDEDVAEIQVSYDLVVDILHHLVQNAIEALSGNGSIILGLHNNGRFVVMEVTDTGPGIPQNEQSKIFGLFYSTKKSSGFGLWSARRNAIKNYGELTVESQPGQGTTFRLSLPKVSRRMS